MKIERCFEKSHTSTKYFKHISSIPFVVKITFAPCSNHDVKYPSPLNRIVFIRHSGRASHRFEDQLDSLLHDIFLTVTDGLKLGWIRDKNLHKRYIVPQEFSMDACVHTERILRTWKSLNTIIFRTMYGIPYQETRSQSPSWLSVDWGWAIHSFPENAENGQHHQACIWC